MGQPKKENDIEKLDNETVVEGSKTVENVTAEVVTGVDEVSSKKEIESLKAQLAEKEKLIETVSAGSQRKVRGEKIKTMPGGNSKAGFIHIYESR